MYARSMVKLPFPPSSQITSEMVREISLIEDFQINYSDRDIVWTRLAIANLDYMIDIAISAGSDYVGLDLQRTQLQSILCKNTA